MELGHLDFLLPLLPLLTDSLRPIGPIETLRKKFGMFAGFIECRLILLVEMETEPTESTDSDICGCNTGLFS